MRSRITLSHWRQASLWNKEMNPATRLAPPAEVTDLISDVCANFARVVNWRPATWLENNVRVFILAETVDADQERSQIELMASAAEDQLRVRGSLYDLNRRHVVVSDQCVPLSWADRHTLGELLTETFVRLRRQKGAYSGSDSSLAWF